MINAAAQEPEDNYKLPSITLINQACREVVVVIGRDFSNWDDLKRQADSLRFLIGLTDTDYLSAMARTSPYHAASCLVILCERMLRKPHQIRNPRGYFYKITQDTNIKSFDPNQALIKLWESNAKIKVSPPTDVEQNLKTSKRACN